MLLEKCLECFNHEFNACEGCRDKEYHLDFIQSTEQDLKDYLKNECNFTLNNPTYKKLDEDLSREVRIAYKTFSSQLNLKPNLPIFAKDGTKIAEGFERIVIGDYGAYIEYDLSQVPKDMKYVYEKGEEYRVDPYWRKKVKYIWYTIPTADIKIYWQLRTVSYADYKVKKFYVSPYEIYQ